VGKLLGRTGGEGCAGGSAGYLGLVCAGTKLTDAGDTGSGSSVVKPLAKLTTS